MIRTQKNFSHFIAHDGSKFAEIFFIMCSLIIETTRSPNIQPKTISECVKLWPKSTDTSVLVQNVRKKKQINYALKNMVQSTGCQCIAEIIVFGLFYVLTD